MKTAAAHLILFMVLLCPVKVASAGNIDDIRSVVYAWADAWQNRNIQRYVSFYSPEFRSKGLDFNGWLQKKTDFFQRPGHIRVEISDLWVFIEGKNATARFIQRYQGPNVSDVGEKTLVLVYSKDQWRIVSEQWTPLAMPVRITRNQEISLNRQKYNADNRPSETAIRKRKIDAEPPNKTIVKSIKLKTAKDHDEVFIALNTFSIPEVQSIEGENPRIIVNINKVSSWRGQDNIPVNGNLIKQIRTYLHRDTEKLRIILDLKYSDDYIIDQTYDRKANIYSISVR
ncbi:MAG: nuclear transport factor 2 family protein [Desulfobacterales bacterium]|jgi:ketosteroid isomerase-like protein